MKNATRTLAVIATVLAVGVPAAAATPGKDRASKAAAVKVCVEYRQMIGRDAFREAFVNLQGCVANVVPTGD